VAATSDAAATSKAAATGTRLALDRTPDGTLRVRLGGRWRLQDALPGGSEIEPHLEEAAETRRLAFDTRELTEWDSGLLTFLRRVEDTCQRREIEIDHEGLPEGARRLLALASAVAEKTGTGRAGARPPLFERVGRNALDVLQGFREATRFVGEVTLSLLRFFSGRAQYRGSDLALTIQECGANALPIVTLISVLVGMILAFVGAIQLEMFGAEVYVADLVGIGMAREMGAMMTAVIMAGRTGAAFAAQLGTMTVNEEIDALRTMAISPVDFLVLPRMLALMLMMPLLTIYSDVLGILGGGLIGVGMLDLSFTQYLQQTLAAVGLDDFLAGFIKGGVFGVIVALAGCLRGMQCGRSAQAVGLATTSAVVTGIVMIVVSDATLTVIYNIVGL
jgi:phospholipid/cholesterol/gamma-HCH transport system permease protein